jgi:hypothetical protein
MPDAKPVFIYRVGVSPASTLHSRGRAHKAGSTRPQLSVQQRLGTLAIGRATAPDRGIARSATATGFTALAAAGREAATVSTTPPTAKNPPIAVITLGTWPRQSHAIAEATSGCT